ncbi:MAG: carbon-phosphorus lyase complex subunit PhnI [Deltaproteobacteria bacterium]|nr:carbon-phosphorus lyase complex subunit PhnI [Deltaproteobacteria bacterium]
MKLPHYVDFQAELSMIREMRKNFKDSVDSTADNSVPEKSPTE